MRPLVFNMREFARSAFFLHALTFLTNRGLPLFSSLLVAVILGPSDFGVFAVAISAFSAVLLLADTGLSIATTSRVASENRRNRNLANRAMLISVLMCSALGLAVGVALATNSASISTFLFGSERYGSIIVAGAIYVPASALALVLQGALAGLQRYGVTASVGMAAGAAYLIAVVTCAYAGDATTAIWGAALGASVRCILLIVVSFEGLLAAARSAKAGSITAEARALLALALPALLTSLVMAPVMTFLIASVGQHPSGPQEAGGLAVSLQIFSLVSVLPSMITQFALPTFAARDHHDPQYVARFAIMSLLSAAIPAAVFLSAPQYMLGLIGSEYVSYGWTLQLIMVAAVVSAPQGTLSNFLISIGMNWVRAFSFVGWGAVVVAVFLWIGDASASSAAISYVFGYALLAVCQTAAVWFFFSERSRRTSNAASITHHLPTAKDRAGHELK